MSEPEGVAQDSAPIPARPHFSILVTVVCSIVVAIYVGLPLGPLLRDASPLGQLDRPEESLERLVTRELDLDEALRHGRGWEWRLYRALSGGDSPIHEARTWYDELADTVDSSSVELRRAILLGESGEADRLEERITRWKEDSGPTERMADWVRAAYLGTPPALETGQALIAEMRDALESNWFADTLSWRIAARIGDANTRSLAEADIVARGRVLQQRQRFLWTLVVVLLLGALLALVRMLTARSPARVADAPLPPDWSTADGYALFVRALGAPQAIVLVLFYFLRRETPFDSVLIIAADLPVFWWVARYLRTRDSSLPAAFGLVPRREGWPKLVGATLILIGLALVLDAVIDTSGALVGLKAHWADGFSEDLLWQPRLAFLVNAFNATVWAPIIEEMTFRGLLYGTLRTQLGVRPAALLSAAIFALPHGYAAAGSLSVLVSGILWAVAYERTRSLLPGLLAHSANNILSTLWVVALLRL
jgi:membrane protease YdiL (CAAX protease family)